MSHTATKSPGQVAYERDVETCPVYTGGKPRKTWAELPATLRQEWERKHSNAPKRRELLDLLRLAEQELAASAFRGSLTLVKIRDALKRAGVP